MAVVPHGDDVSKTSDYPPPTGEIQTLIDSALRELGAKRSVTGGGGNIAIRCPNPDHKDKGRDKSPSASFHPGKWVWACGKCGGGGWRHFCQAVGIELPTNGQPATHPRPVDSSNRKAKSNLPKLRRVAAYNYKTDAGHWRKIRREGIDAAGDRVKNFFWLAVVDGRGIPLAKSDLTGCPPTLYQLDALAQAIHEDGAPVFIVEGEKAVDAIAELGLVATTNPEGAGPSKWQPHHTELLEGARVVVVGDLDDVGQEHAAEIAASIRPVAASCKVIDLAKLAQLHGLTLPAKSGLDDLVELRARAGATDDEIAAEISAHVEGLTEYALPGWPGVSPILYRDFVRLDIPQREVVLQMTGKTAIRAGDLVLFESQRGVGKSWLSLGLGVSTGSGQRLFGYQVPKPFPTLHIDGEMLPDEIIERQNIYQPHRKAPIDPQTGLISKRYIQGFHGLSLPPLNEAEGQALAWNWMQEFGAKVLILDNVSALCSHDENKGHEWHPFNEWLGWVRAHGVTIFVFHHLGKDAGRGGRGSSKLEDAPCAVAQLTTPKGHIPSKGCSFDLTWTKARNLHGVGVINCALQSTEDGSDIVDWTIADTCPSGEALHERVIQAYLDNQDMTQIELAKELGLAKSTISKHLKRAEEQEEIPTRFDI